MKIKLYKLLLASGVIAAVIAGCKKDDPNQFLKDNVTVVGYNPVIASFTTVPASTTATTTVAAGATVKLDLRYWSDDAIDKVNLNATIGTAAKTTISTTPYQKAYSSVSRTDSLNLQYQVPAGTASGTTIVVEAQVINKNTLTAASTVNLKVQ
jgi:hypothetical protein